MSNAGNIIWAKHTEATNAPNAAHFIALSPTSDEGCAVIGYSMAPLHSCAVIKFDSSGAISWSRAYSGFVGYRIVQIPGSTHFYITGSSISSYPIKSYIGRLNGSGNVVWMKVISSPSYDDLRAVDITTTSDGKVICVISAYNINFPNSETIVIKLDQNGNPEWHTEILGLDREEIRRVIKSPDGGFYLIGTRTTGSGSDGLLIKIDSDGNLQWAKTYGGNNSYFSSGVIDNNWLLMSGTTTFFGSGGNDIYLVFADPVNPDNPCCGSNHVMTTTPTNISINDSPTTSVSPSILINTFTSSIQSGMNLNIQCP